MIVVYILVCMIILLNYNIIEMSILNQRRKKIPTTIISASKFTDMYLGKFDNSMALCIYYGDVYKELSNIKSLSYPSFKIERVINEYESQLYTIIADAHNKNNKVNYKSFNGFRHDILKTLKESNEEKVADAENNKYKEITKLLDSIKDKDTRLDTNESDSLHVNALGITNVFFKFGHNDEEYKTRVLTQLTMIDNYLNRLLEESMSPGTKKYIENELDINQRYLNSVIDQDIINGDKNV